MTDTPHSTEAARAAYAARAAAYADAYAATRAAYVVATLAAADQAIVADAIAAHGADAARVYREAEARHIEEAQWCDRFSDERRKLEIAGSYGRIAALIEAATGKDSDPC